MGLYSSELASRRCTALFWHPTRVENPQFCWHQYNTLQHIFYILSCILCSERTPLVAVFFVFCFSIQENPCNKYNNKAFKFPRKNWSLLRNVMVISSIQIGRKFQGEHTKHFFYVIAHYANSIHLNTLCNVIQLRKLVC